MRTDELIRAMAADRESTRPVRAVLPWVLLAVAAVVGLVFLLIVGPRPDPGAALHQLPVLIKQLFPLLLAVGGFGAALRLARPEGSVGRWGLLLAAAPLLLLAAALTDLALLPPGAWHAAMMGSTHRFCLAAISLMSLPILAGSFWVLKTGATTRPVLAGAITGVMSAGTATALYAIHCTEDSPLFYATWYGLAILAVTALGALLGRRLLRW